MTADSPTQGTPGSEVFVSYASQDTAVANAIVEALERNGLRCWIAPRDVRAGAQYADAIVRAISDAKVFVLVLSANAGASSHVGKEIERASSKKRPIIALRIDAAPLTPALEYFLSESQWIEAQPGMMEAAYAKLIDAIREPDRTALTNFPAVDPKASVRTAPALHPISRRNRILFAAALAVVGVTLAALWAANFWQAEQVTAEQSTTAAETAVSDKSIAVLPFVDMSAEKNQEYMADGIAEELLNLLAQVPDLKVIARTSSFAFKGQNIEIAEIAKKLNVAHVLEGSVRKSGNKLRITAQLVRAADSTHLWSQTYDRPLDDIFAVQDEIANAIMQALQIKLMGGALSRREGGTQNLEAYQLALRANAALYQSTRSSLEAMEQYAEQAIKLDPSYGWAWALLADSFVIRTSLAYLPPTEGYERARQLAQHALLVSPNLAYPHAVLQWVYQTYDWDWAAAEAEQQRALAIDPTNSTALNVAGRLSCILGRWDDSKRQLRAARARDPLEPYAAFNLAITYYAAGDFAKSESTYRELLELDPSGSGWVRAYLGKTLLMQGKVDAALTMLKQDADPGAQLAYLPIFLHAAGRQADADAALKALIAHWADAGAFYVAQNYAYRGEHDLALEWLERAYREKDQDLVEIIGEHLFKSMADDPQYKAFLRKMNLSV